MRLPSNLVDSENGLLQVIDRFEGEPLDPRIRVMYCSETQALAAIRFGEGNDEKWQLMAEDSIYEPEPVVSEEGEEHPFFTSGKAWLIDPKTGIITTDDDFCFEEGTIQGLIYAIDRLGDKPNYPESYVDFLMCWSEDFHYIGEGDEVAPFWHTIYTILKRANIVREKVVPRVIGMELVEAEQS